MDGAEFLASKLGSASTNATLNTANHAIPTISLGTLIDAIGHSFVHDTVPLFLIFGVFIFWYLAQKKKLLLDELADKHETNERGLRLAWMSADNYQTLVALVEQYTYGDIPWGPWDVSSIRDRWPQKKYLKRLIRAGIIPLRVSGGGVRTYQESGWKFDGWRFWNISPPVFVQTKGRAYFDFIMLYPNGFEPAPIVELDKARREFMDRLKLTNSYSVTAAHWEKDGYNFEELTTRRHTGDDLEVGATSWLKPLLPFKKDKVLEGAYMAAQLGDFVENPSGEIPLLAKTPHAIVHMEALDLTPKEPVEYTHEIQRTARLFDLWPEDEMSMDLSALYRSLRLDFDA